MIKKINRKFFLMPTLKVAQELLGKFILHQVGNKTLIGKIIETEAYLGTRDKASHSYGGKITPRNKIEYLIGGHIYIYFIYGMYWQLNITTGAENIPECVLIRALEPISGIDEMVKNRKTNDLKNLTSGPGKLCQAMQFDKKIYGLDLTSNNLIWIEDRGIKISNKNIIKTPRIGINYAEEFVKKPWRFVVKQ